MHQGTRERQFLLHATRQGARLAVLEALDLAIDGADAVIALLDRRAKQGGKEPQVLLHGQVLIKRELARHIPHPAAYLAHLGHDIIAIDRRCPRLGQQQGAQDAIQRRLAGAVRPDQAKHLSLAHGERHFVERRHLAIVLGHVMYLDCIHWLVICLG